MKSIIYLIIITASLSLIGCSDTEQDITSPIAPQISKGVDEFQSFPYKIYQTFPELNTAKIGWHYEKDGLIIYISDYSTYINKQLFAVIEYAERPGVSMSFLGYSNTGKYFMKGINKNEVQNIRIFSYEVTSDRDTDALPYPKSNLFSNIGVEGWADGGTMVKIKSTKFPTDLKHLFGQLVSKEGNQLIFLGKPNSEDFDFPKSEKISLVDIKLFAF
ncbi:MAG: hypothetical protein R6W68_01550 [Ignavibacteriaceae bacterium]